MDIARRLVAVDVTVLTHVAAIVSEPAVIDHRTAGRPLGKKLAARVPAAPRTMSVAQASDSRLPMSQSEIDRGR